MSKRLERAAWVLENIPLGKIQSGMTFSREMMGEKPDGTKVHYTRYHKIAGTNIPASTLHRIALPETHPQKFTPSDKTIDALSQFYQRYQYNTARAYGAQPQEAQTVRHFSPEKAEEYIKDLYKIAIQISKNRDVPVEYIIAGMQQSKKYHDVGEWENYVDEELDEELSLEEEIQVNDHFEEFEGLL